MTRSDEDWMRIAIEAAREAAAYLRGIADRPVRDPAAVAVAEQDVAVGALQELGLGIGAGVGHRDAAVVVEAHVVPVRERVALAGGAHVVVAVEAQLDRAARPARHRPGRWPKQTARHRWTTTGQNVRKSWESSCRDEWESHCESSDTKAV